MEFWGEQAGPLERSELWMLGKDPGCGNEERGLWNSAHRRGACGEIRALLSIPSPSILPPFHTFKFCPLLLFVSCLGAPRLFDWVDFARVPADICLHLCRPLKLLLQLRRASSCVPARLSARRRRIHSNLHKSLLESVQHRITRIIPLWLDHKSSFYNQNSTTFKKGTLDDATACLFSFFQRSTLATLALSVYVCERQALLWYRLRCFYIASPSN